MTVYLVDDATFVLSSHPSPNFEHRLFPLQEPDTERVDVRRSGQEVRYTQHNRDDEHNLFGRSPASRHRRSRGHFGSANSFGCAQNSMWANLLKGNASLRVHRPW